MRMDVQTHPGPHCLSVRDRVEDSGEPREGPGILIWSIIGLVAVIVAFAVGLARNNKKNDSKNAEAIQMYIEEKAKLDAAAPSAEPGVTHEPEKD